MTMKDIVASNQFKQEYLANAFKTTQQSISFWINGKRSPSIELLPKLAEILNCSIEELVLALIETRQAYIKRIE